MFPRGSLTGRPTRPITGAVVHLQPIAAADVGASGRAWPFVAAVWIWESQRHAASPPVVTDSGADGGKQPESLRHPGLGGRRSHFCEGHPGECKTGHSACR